MDIAARSPFTSKIMAECLRSANLVKLIYFPKQHHIYQIQQVVSSAFSTIKEHDRSIYESKRLKDQVRSISENTYLYID